MWKCQEKNEEKTQEEKIMIEYVERFLNAMRPAFSRQATFVWFVVAFVGFVVRTDNFGVSSIVRALWLEPSYYPCLLHFFHSNAWNVEGLMRCWWYWLIEENIAFTVGERIVLIADHTKIPKDGRCMPAVVTLRQDSETSSKPGFFRGHHWGCIGLMVNAGRKFFSVPLLAGIHQGLEVFEKSDFPGESMISRIINMAELITQTINKKAYLVLDAFFATGTTFNSVTQSPDEKSPPIHILTRAKRNIVAYRKPRKKKKRLRGRPRIYGTKLKLFELFGSWNHKFKQVETEVYNGRETVRYLTLNLIWKPTKGFLRFFLIETSRGRIILMTSDLQLEPLTAIKLYCRRVAIETFFDTLKNIMGGMAYHFWSMYLKPQSRRPVKSEKCKQGWFSSAPEKTRNTFDAIEKFVNIQLLVVGVLQLLACKFPLQVWNKARCWLRTFTSEIPSEFVTRTALTSIFRNNLFSFGKDWITGLIIQKQNPSDNTMLHRKTG